jgi:hypothetical protein
MKEAEQNKLDWRMHAWHLERVAAIREQFGDPNKVGVQINQQFNNGTPGGFNSEELERMRTRLDEIKLRQQKWRSGIATNAELRETMIRQIEQCQHVVDCIDRDETPGHEDQQQLYQDLKQSSAQQEQPPVRSVEGHVVSDQLAIEDQNRPEPETRPQRPSPQIHSMCASDMYPESGQPRKQSEGGSAPPGPPAAEPEHVPWRDRKPVIGPLSTRQKWEADEKRRRGSDGKGIF